MEPPKINIDHIINKTQYFQGHLETLLCHLQSTFHCLRLTIKILLHGPDGCGKRMLAQAAANNLNVKFFEERVADLFDENIVGTEKKVRSTITKFASSTPCLIYFTGYELFCKLEDSDLDRIEHCIKESLDEISSSEQPVVFIAATNDFDQVYRTPLSEIFQHEISVRSPTRKQAEDIVETIKLNAGLKSDPSKWIDSYLSSDGDYHLGNIFNMIACCEVAHHCGTKSDPMDVEHAKQNGGTRWMDIGGLSDVKEEIIDTIKLSIDYPQLKKSGLRRTGILLFGPPGTGKTLLAKAVATECGLNFINIKGPELLNEYVGQSEDNIRKLFQKARDSSPCVIFFDEIDSLAPSRGQAGDSGGVMDRMVSQLLAEMDGIGKSDGVFIIGATNRVDLVDSSLLRPGRFDKILEVPMPSGTENRIAILKALTRKMRLADDVDLSRIESLARSEMSGADFQGLCSRALQRTFDRCVKQVEAGETSEDEVEIITTLEDFLQSLKE